MEKFELILPKNIIFGADVFKRAAEKIKQRWQTAERIMIITGKTWASRSGILQELIEGLRKQNINKIEHFGGIEPEPKCSLVDTVVEYAKIFSPEVIIGLGGGSVLDVAKVCAFIFKDGHRVREYYKNKQVKVPGCAFVAIPTLSGSGAEVTYNAVIIDDDKENMYKKSIRDERMIAELVIIDPLLSMNCKKEQRIISAMDALTHLLEGYVSKRANVFTDRLAEEGIKLLLENILPAIENNDKDCQVNLSYASLLGGIVLANASLGAIHGIAASIGALFSIPHGRACCMLLPYVMEFNEETIAEKLKRLEEKLHLQVLEQIEKLLEEFNLLNKLSIFGASETDIPRIIEGVSSSINYNPKPMSKEDIEKILKKMI